MSSFFRRSNTIDLKEIIAEELMILPRVFEETGDVCGQITHRNVSCPKLTLYFVSHTLMRFIIKGISVHIPICLCIALHTLRIRFVAQRCTLTPGLHGLDVNGRYPRGEEK